MDQNNQNPNPLNQTPNQNLNPYFQYQNVPPGFGFANFTSQPPNQTQTNTQPSPDQSFSQLLGMPNPQMFNPYLMNPYLFQQFQQQNLQQQQNPPTTPSQHRSTQSSSTMPTQMFSLRDEDDVNVVPDSPPDVAELTTIERKKKSKKKAVRHERETSPNGCQRWSSDEIVALAKAYLAATENSSRGNHIVAGEYWLSVLDNFHAIRDPENRTVYRNRNQITSKWHEVAKKVSWFYCAVGQLQHQSGSDNFDVVARAKRQYEVEHGHKFPYESCWNYCRTNPKWDHIMSGRNWAINGMASSNSSGSKRSRRSIDINAEGTDEAGEQTSERRPLGRDPSRAKNRGKRVASSADNANTPDFAAYHEIQKQKLELERDFQKQKLNLEKVELEMKKLEKIIDFDDSRFEGEALETIKQKKLEAMLRLAELQM